MAFVGQRPMDAIYSAYIWAFFYNFGGDQLSNVEFEEFLVILKSQTC